MQKEEQRKEKGDAPSEEEKEASQSELGFDRESEELEEVEEMDDKRQTRATTKKEKKDSKQKHQDGSIPN